MMGDDWKPRLVSGEIMTGAGASAPRPAGDFVEAEDADAPLAARDEAGGFLNPVPGEAAGSPRKASGLLFAVTGALAALLAFWIAGGHQVVLGPLGDRLRDAPARALQIEGLRSRVETGGTAPRLVVDGRAYNGGAQALALPALIISVGAQDGTVARYRLAPTIGLLGPGQAQEFSSRLDAPAGGVASVSVTFEEGGD